MLTNRSVFPNKCWNPTAPIEWWFLQGFYIYEGETQFFMQSVFRQHLDQTGSGHGYTLMSSFHSENGESNNCLVQIDPDIFNRGIDRMRQKGSVSKDRHLMNLYADELTQNGPIPPIKMAPSRPMVSTDSLSFEWDSVCIKQIGNQIEFSLPASILNLENEFILTPLSPRYTVMSPTDETHPDQTMEYETWPVCDLEGRVGRKPVTGKVWLDHQWGGYGMFSPKDGKKRLGWDWFGITLENNQCWIVSRHTDLMTGEIIKQLAVQMNPDGTTKKFETIQVLPNRTWTSPRTGTTYPIEWEIRIKELVFYFRPHFDDQELPVFGQYRSIWEGAGMIECRQNKTILKGEARGEFFGYGYVQDLKSYFEQFKTGIRSDLDTFFPQQADSAKIEEYVGPCDFKQPLDAYNKTIFEPVQDLMRRNGKLWRPIFSFLMLESLGCPSKKYQSLLSILTELSHTGSLIIDDIEDNSPVRRGKAAIHEKYGIDIAINAGNTVYFLPFLKVGDHPDLSKEQKADIYDILVKAYVNAHLGQAADIYWSNDQSIDNLLLKEDTTLPDQILGAYRAKTASILMGITGICSVIAKTDKKIKTASIAFAQDVGIAFQLMDDIRNFDSKTSRKKWGEDICEGKLTYLLAIALLKLKKPKKDQLIHIISNITQRKNKEAIEQAIGLIQQSGAIDLVRDKATRLFDSSWERFSTATQFSEARIWMKLLCFKLLNL